LSIACGKPAFQIAGQRDARKIWLTKGLPNAPDFTAASYLFVEPVLFQLLNQY
jgi:hypothetical protein